MVRMKNKNVTEFRNHATLQPEVPSDDPMILFSREIGFCHPVDCYRGKSETGGSDLDAEAAPEGEAAALDSDLNDQIFSSEACHVNCACIDASRD